MDFLKIPPKNPRVKNQNSRKRNKSHEDKLHKQTKKNPWQVGKTNFFLGSNSSINKIKNNLKGKDKLYFQFSEAEIVWKMKETFLRNSFSNISCWIYFSFIAIFTKQDRHFNDGGVGTLPPLLFVFFLGGGLSYSKHANILNPTTSP